jgi:hypothetical protein
MAPSFRRLRTPREQHRSQSRRAILTVMVILTWLSQMGGCILLEGYADCGDGHTIILLGNGDGTFQDHVDYTTGTYPTSQRWLI